MAQNYSHILAQQHGNSLKKKKKKKKGKAIGSKEIPTGNFLQQQQIRNRTDQSRKLIFPAGGFPCKPEVDFGMTDKCQGNVKSRNQDRIYRGWESLRTGKKERKKEREKERMGVL